ncbi:MAG: hypothetical protein WCL32_24495, partial [Planctomycetota bacterium]
QLAMPTSTFEPSTATKSLYLFTRKKRVHVFPTIPGMFGTHLFAIDVALFVLFVLIGEGFGLAMLYIFVPTIDPWGIVGLVVGDLAAAVAYHWDRKSDVLLKNQLFVTDPNNPGAIVAVKTRYRSLHIWKTLGGLAVVGIATFKILSINEFRTEMPPGSLVSVMIAYVVAGLVHLNATGYFIFECLRRIFEAIDRAAYDKDLGRVDEGGIPASEVRHASWAPRVHPFTSENTIIEGGFGNGHQVVVSGPGQYEFRINGLLTDSELEEAVLLQGVHRGSKSDVAISGKQLQLLQLNTDPVPLQVAAGNESRTPPQKAQ